MKRLLKIAAVTIAVIIAILITVMILAVLLFPKERVITIIELQASVALGMPVEVGDAGISFLGIPALRVNDTILGPPPGATEPLAVLPSVRVEVNILKLLKREIEIVAVEFSRPEISFTVSARETATESRTTGAPSTGGAPPIPFPLTMNMLSVRNGRITIDQIAPGSRVVFEDVNQRLTLSISPDLSGLDARGMVSSGNIAFSSAALDEPVSGIAAAFEFLVNGDVGAGNLTIDRGDLRLNDLTVSVKGSLEEWEQAFFSLSTGEVDARGVLELIPGSILPLKELITADGTFSLEIDGGIDTSTPVPAVRFTGDLDIGHMRLGVRGFPRRIDDISARIAFTEKNISIDRFLVSTGSTAVNLNGIITSYLTSPEVKLGFGGILEIGDFTGALPILSENNVHGQIDFDLGVEGHGYDPITYEPSGTMTLRGLSFDLPGVLRNACALNGVIMVTPGTLTLDDLGIRSGKSDFEFAGSLVGWMSLVMPHSGERAVFTSTLSSTLIDLGDLLVIDETKEPEIIMPWEMKDAIEAMPIPPNLNAGMDVALGRVTFGRLTADSVKGVLTLSDGAFRLSGLSVGAYQGTLTGDA